MFKRFKKHRPDQALESEMDGVTTDSELSVDPLESLGPCSTPEPAIVLNHSSNGTALWEKARPFSPRYFTTSGLSSMSSMGSNISRQNSKTRPPDPVGLTLVYECDNNPIVDLIFVHGLGGSSLRTWSYDREIKNFWPTWLANETGLSEARLFTFGYNANLAHQDTTISILDFAKALLFRVKMYQGKDNNDGRPIGDRPLIFIVHSMGGLVVKKAYILGRADVQYSHIISQTYGIVFLGTPHGGSSCASTLRNIIRAIPTIGSKIYVNELEKDSLSIVETNEQFRTICGDLDLVSFYETLKTTISPGVKMMIVEKKSAILGYPTEISAPLNADHHGLVKFLNPEDGNYRDVCNVLKMFVNRIKQTNKNTGRHHSKSAEPSSPSPATIHHILGIKTLSDDLEIVRQQMVSGSCCWILEKCNYRNWIEANNSTSSILWLTGLPATGKSTLSGFIIDHLNRLEIPASCQYHFFHSWQHDTRTISYTLRSIALQIAEVYDEFRNRLLEIHQQSGILLASQRYNVIWEKVYEELLFRLNLKDQLFWVLDGMDEAESPATLVSLISKINSATAIKVLLVSRETRELSAALSLGRHSIYHENIQIDDTISDIRSYVSTTLHRVLPDDEKLGVIIEKVLSKASGSFLWTRLAVEKIKDNWHTDADIERALTEIPEGMELMYSRMLTAIAAQPPNVREMATKILTWATCSFRPLAIDELGVALKAEFGSFYNLRATINQICGNFVITKKTSVVLIHQTAQQYLTSKDPGLPISITSRCGHEQLAGVCIAFLSDIKWRSKLSSLRHAGDPLEDHPFKEIPFLLYATSYWAYHVSHASAESDKLQATILEFLEKYVLSWIQAVCLTGDLQIITHSARNLKLYAKRVQRLRRETMPTGSSRDDELVQWSNDLIRLVGRFGCYLFEDPSSIYKYIIPFCPSESMLSKTFRHIVRGPMNVTGISPSNWDDCLTRLTMGGDETASRVICKDGYFITLLETSGTLVVWIAETCLEYRRLHHGEWVTCIKAARSRNLIASAGKKTVRVWDISQGKEILNLPKLRNRSVMALAFQNNDTELLIANDDCTIQCINLDTSKERWCFRAYDPSKREFNCPRLMAFSEDATRIAIARRGRPVFVWRIGLRKQLPQRCIRQADMYKSEDSAWNSPEIAIWQPGSSNVLILYQDTVLVYWNIDDDTQTEHSHIEAREMAVSADGNLLLTSNYKGSLSVWSTGQFRLIYRINYEQLVEDITFSPDGQRIYDSRGTLCNVWEPAVLVQAEELSREDLSSHETVKSDPEISSDNNNRIEISSVVCADGAPYYCAGKQDGSVAIYEMQTGKKIRKLYGHGERTWVTSIAWSSSQKYIASADDWGCVIAKRLKKPTPSAPHKWAVYPLLKVHLSITATQLLFSSCENFLLISTPNSDEIWNTQSKMKVFEKESEGGRYSYRRWLNHPTEPEILICIDGDEQSFYSWKDLGRIEPSNSFLDNPASSVNVAHGINELSVEDTLNGQIDSQPALQTASEAPKHIVLIKRRYVVLEYTVSRGLNSNCEQTSKQARRLELIDLNENPLRRKNLFQLSAHVNRLMGVFQVIAQPNVAAADANFFNSPAALGAVGRALDGIAMEVVSRVVVIDVVVEGMLVEWAVVEGTLVERIVVVGRFGAAVIGLVAVLGGELVVAAVEDAIEVGADMESPVLTQ